MTGAVGGARTAGDRADLPDLRRATLAEVRATDFRAAGRDLFRDEAAIWDRFRASWAGLDDSAWLLPGAAPSDAGGPDWSLADHVGHVADWQELAIGYLGRVRAGGPWPADDDFEGGDFDRFNERRREEWSRVAPVDIRARLADGHHRLRGLVEGIQLATIRSDTAWGWIYMVLHGHQLDHLGVLEPWTAALRERQVAGDPFTADPRPAGDGSPVAVASFWARAQSVFGLFDVLVRPVPIDRWEEPGPTSDWTLKDHVAHVARWFDEGRRAIEEHRTSGSWTADPAEGLDAWNAREHAAARAVTPEEAIGRFDSGYAALRAVVAAMTPSELASADGGDWAYECLHGHVRAHLAMVAPWIVRLDWPAAREPR
jgi:hypothetical protein